MLEQIEDARTKDLLSVEEARDLRDAELARQAVIAVDDFSPNELCRQTNAQSLKTKKNTMHQGSLPIDVANIVLPSVEI